MKIKIEKNVPMRSSSKLIEAFKQLEIGDSFLLPLRLQSKASTYAERCGIRVQTRKTDDQQVRIWRVA